MQGWEGGRQVAAWVRACILEHRRADARVDGCPSSTTAELRTARPSAIMQVGSEVGVVWWPWQQYIMKSC